MVGEDVIRYRGKVSGPRWAGLPSAIREGAMRCGLEVVINTEKGWICEDVFFEVSGEEPRVNRFERTLRACIKDWNK